MRNLLLHHAGKSGMARSLPHNQTLLAFAPKAVQCCSIL